MDTNFDENGFWRLRWEFFCFCWGSVLAAAGAWLVNNGWAANPHDWAMVILGGVMVVIGVILAGVIFID